jgi:formylglycine-generating enzyme required for sulfatase activity
MSVAAPPERAAIPLFSRVRSRAGLRYEHKEMQPLCFFVRTKRHGCRTTVVALLPLVVAVLPGCGGDGSNGGMGDGGESGAGGSGDVPFDCPAGDPGAMVDIPAGDFMMGCNPAVDNRCAPDEQPGRTVALSAYAIDKTEVTQEAYAACVLAGQCQPPSCEWNCGVPGMPAGCITRPQAESYCQFIGARLPTEAEWEKGARGTDGRKYPWGNQEPDCNLANQEGCGGKATPVDAHGAGASPYGLLDMAGNMVEIVADWYDAEYYASAPAADPKGPATGKRFVGRGGGWQSAAQWQRASSRDWYDLTDAGTSFGFRCAR